jgi:UDP-2,3-diacylglucosamine hydrolase
VKRSSGSDSLRTPTPPSFPIATSSSWLKLGQLGRLIEFFTANGVTHVVMAGPINKPRALDLRPDWRAARLLFSIKSRGDDVLLRALTTELERDGLTVVAPHLYSPDLLAPEGVLTRRKPTDRERAGRHRHSDGRFRWIWDASTSANAWWCGKKSFWPWRPSRGRTPPSGAAASSADRAPWSSSAPSRPRTRRLDMPAVGLGTLKAMAEVGASCLAVEAGALHLLSKWRAPWTSRTDTTSPSSPCPGLCKA